MTARIINAHIAAMPRSLGNPMPQLFVTLDDPLQQVFVTLDDGTNGQFLFDFYSDEMTFTPEEFVGLTIDEAHTLKCQKDCAYLRS